MGKAGGNLGLHLLELARLGNDAFFKKHLERIDLQLTFLYRSLGTVAQIRSPIIFQKLFQVVYNENSRIQGELYSLHRSSPFNDVYAEALGKRIQFGIKLADLEGQVFGMDYKNRPRGYDSQK
jgi:hypothetical protein